MNALPSTGFTLETDRLAWLTSRLADAPEVVIREVRLAVLEAEMLLVREAADRTPTATGLLRASIAPAMPEVLEGGTVAGAVVTDKEHRGGIVIGVGAPLSYAVPVELGTRPHLPPLQPLIDWVQLKLGIRNPEEQEQVARKIRWKIRHRGTAGAHMFRQALEATMPQIREIFAKHLRAAAGQLSEAPGG
ncbi:MAG: HK97 gp10 family phage protein [Magnetococcales bacterium]|nr:HK97 gp10 family phage protein [Magnetococcales bacterium]